MQHFDHANTAVDRNTRLPRIYTEEREGGLVYRISNLLGHANLFICFWSFHGVPQTQMLNVFETIIILQSVFASPFVVQVSFAIISAKPLDKKHTTRWRT